MRKADYETLARVIAEDRKTVQRFPLSDANCQAAVLAHSEAIARGFAATTSVEKAQFLKACGID